MGNYRRIKPRCRAEIKGEFLESTDVSDHLLREAEKYNMPEIRYRVGSHGVLGQSSGLSQLGATPYDLGRLPAIHLAQARPQKN